MATIRVFLARLCFLSLGCGLSCFAVTVNGSDPNSSIYKIVPGQTYAGLNFDGLGFFNNGGALCSGSLLSPVAFLTAAHCVTDWNGTALSPLAASVTFDVPGASGDTLQTSEVSQYFVHPGYLPDTIPTTGLRDFRNDIAIVILSAPAPVSVYYPIYRDTGNELSAGTFTLAGYGYGGTGAGYHADPSYAPDAATKRMAQNAYINFFGPDGTETRSKSAYVSGAATSLEFSFSSTGNGLGVLEGMVAPGDSGGPSFVNGQIAGIHSQILCLADSNGYCIAADPYNVDAGSYGEFGMDTMVSIYANWIDGVVASTQPVPEPGAWSLLAAGALGLAWKRARV